MADIERGGWLLFTKQLMLYLPSGNPESAEEFGGGTILTEIGGFTHFGFGQEF